MADTSNKYPTSLKLSIVSDKADYIAKDINNLKVQRVKLEPNDDPDYVKFNISFDVNQTGLKTEEFDLTPGEDDLLSREDITFLELKKLNDEDYKIEAKQMPLLTITSSVDDNTKTIDLSFIILSYFLGAGDKLKGSAGDKLKGSAGDKLKGSAGDKLKGSAGAKLKGSAGGKLKGSAGALLPNG